MSGILSCRIFFKEKVELHFLVSVPHFVQLALNGKRMNIHISK